jgi:NAD+ synthase (glutamine-hydrolysing)
MCKHVLNTYETLTGFNKKIMEDDLMRIIGKIPESPKEMLSKIVYTAYMGCKNTSEASLSRSNAIAEDFGSTHIHGGIDEICDAYLEAFVQTTGGEAPKYQTEGGGEDEDIALQTLQSRVRMVLSYISGQLLPMAYGRNGFLIVLSYSCLEQNLCGYITKYGLSSGDINPIGCISQSDLKNILHTMKDEYQSLHRILEEKCEINELKPINVDAETDLEITFEEIRMFAYYRKVEKYGPFRCL